MNAADGGPARTAKRIVCLAAVALVLSVAGCGKLKSAADSLFHRGRSAKTTSPALPPRAVSGPRLAIILDDIASDRGAVDSIFALHYPLTLSVLPNHPQSAEIAREAHRRGYQIMLHLPMESVVNEVAEPQELHPGMTSTQIASELNGMLGGVPFVAGVNNHQGSLATADPQLMAELMPMLRSRHLFFIDSRTTAATVAYDSARAAGVPTAFRNVPFLDDVRDVAAIRRQLDLAAKDAREKGEAIAIGHPHSETLHALSEFLPRAESQGIHLVHASDLVH